MIDVTKVAFIKKGMLVEISVPETPKNPTHRGVVAKILSKKDDEYGVRVLLTDGRSGHIHDVVTKAQLEKETFIFFNKLFHDGLMVAVYLKNKKNSLEYFIDNQERKAVFLFQNRENGVKWLQTSPYYQENYELRLLGNKQPTKTKLETREKDDKREWFTHVVLNGEMLFTKEEWYEIESKYRTIQ